MEGNYMFLKSFESKLIEMRVSSSIEDRLDYIYNTLDDLLLDGEFCVCDFILNNIDKTKLDIYDFAGILTITYPWKSGLVFRQGFYDSCFYYANKILPPEEVKEILYGFDK